MFVDQVQVKLKAGRGGDGCVSFRREAKVPRGGPDGGHGGNGGSVVFVSDASVHSLSYFRFHPLLRARNGAPGEGGNRTGARGAEMRLPVPVGTVVKDAATGDLLFDFVRPGQALTAAKGGKGGRGNASYATATHQAPREWEPGRPGEEKELSLELKLIADVGLVGFPNAGKSTLISKISAARPLIADYPFTTLTPNLGVVDAGAMKSFIVADIPGLIEGAHLGQGLGDRFLRHIERTRVLVHVVDVSPYTGRDPVQDFDVVMRELASFDARLARRTMIVAANKVDLLGRDKSRLTGIKRLAARRKMPFFAISAIKAEGLKPLVRAMAETLARLEEDGPGGVS
ncbi:MAG TPA: GTPase ObgE [Terriglobales bacterium]|nr:GTPase ObgE [Terriglobales bacterium]